MTTLVHLPYSPWSEKARFALDHHRIPHRRVTYQPMVGELPLRLATRRFRGRVSVPVLLADEGPIFDSMAIARWADAHGSGASLFPTELASEIERWNTTSEAALAAGRKLALARSLESPEAQRDGLEGVVPAPLRGVARPVAIAAIRFLGSKYAASAVDEGALESALVALREALAKSGGAYVLGRFTYADIAMAAVLQCVEPASDRFVPMKPSIRATFRDPGLAARFADLVAWRDRLYDERRSA